ncbi:MAG: aromatic amino acid lyase, partial [Myxococcota bacterium]|nr:aromatic amino acid lyase [Myxococcota bacterium]
MAESRPSPLPIDGDHLTLADVVDVARGLRTARLSGPARAQMTRSYEWVREAGKGDAPVYGVNTGFGSLARVPIEAKDRARLSLNLVRSHAAGVGPALPEAVVRAMMLLR